MGLAGPIHPCGGGPARPFRKGCCMMHYSHFKRKKKGKNSVRFRRMLEYTIDCNVAAACPW